MIFSPYDNASNGDESIGFLALAISLFSIILPSATILPFNVGYQSIQSLAGGKSYLGTTFEKVNGESVKLGDIGVNSLFVPLSDTLTILDEYGGEKSVYVYLDAETAESLNDGTDFKFVAGWYDYYELNSWDEASTLPNYNNELLSEGLCFMVQVSEEGAALVVSGMVAAIDPELECTQNAKTFLCNCTPSPVKLGEILVNENFVPLSDTFTVLDQYGGEKSVYVYLDAETAESLNDGTDFKFVAGWYDYYELNSWDEASTLPNYNSVIFNPGEGFMMQVSELDSYIILPSAI